MATVQEALKQSGFSQEQIDALDQKALATFGSILTSAEQKEQEAKAAATKAEADRQAALKAKEEMELQGRSNVEFYETKIVPGLVGYEDEKKNLEAARINAQAEVAFYKSQIEGAKTAGFVPSDAPAFTPPAVAQPIRDGNGRFVTNAPGSTPGSPTFIDQKALEQRLDMGLGTIADIQWKYQFLNGGKPLPISPTQLIQQAEAVKLSPMEWAARTFKFPEKEEELRQQAAKAHDDEIRNAAIAEKEKEKETEIAALKTEHQQELRKRAESVGNNPEVRVAGPARMSEVRAAVKAGDAKDPLKMTDAERRSATRQLIHKDLEQQENAVA